MCLISGGLYDIISKRSAFCYGIVFMNIKGVFLMREGRKAATVGVTSILVYVANYYLRHILSVLTPTLVGNGFTIEHIAALSSTYMLLYAAG